MLRLQIVFKQAIEQTSILEYFTIQYNTIIDEDASGN